MTMKPALDIASRIGYQFMIYGPLTTILGAKAFGLPT